MHVPYLQQCLSGLANKSEYQEKGAIPTQWAGSPEACQGVEGAEHGPQGLDPDGDGSVLIPRLRPRREAPRLHEDQVLHSVASVSSSIAHVSTRA